tara:strand:- start:8040 stop:8240 length:201 start_codon:yes stop_codon:yes gene_type:complete
MDILTHKKNKKMLDITKITCYIKEECERMKRVPTKDLLLFGACLLLAFATLTGICFLTASSNGCLG